MSTEEFLKLIKPRISFKEVTNLSESPLVHNLTHYDDAIAVKRKAIASRRRVGKGRKEIPNIEKALKELVRKRTELMKLALRHSNKHKNVKLPIKRILRRL